ncbi:MAG TPA: flagellin [Bryobacteraceae bacterium]|nr:flagellin [Bryobacteraceae bacterium]
MISNLNPTAQQFVDGVNRISDDMQKAQSQLSTGLRVTQVSDAPDEISTLLQARANLSATQQIQSNLGRVKTEVDAGEQALQSAVQLFDQVQTLGAEGDTDTATAEARADLAQELGSILQQMVGLTGTTVEGRFIFSGDSDQQVPYTVDLTQANPVSAYLGSASTRVAQHPNGTTFSIAETAQTIFDSADASTNVFAAINNLRNALVNNDDASIQSAVNGLSKAGEYLNRQLAFYGTTQNKIAEATDYGSTLATQLQVQIGNLEDADMTAAIEDFTQAQVQQQAALESRAQMPRATLFDYLA